MRLSQTPVVSAGEIFRRAVASERDSFSKVSHSAVYQKLRVRIGRSSLEHEVDLAVVAGDEIELRARGRSIMVWMDFELAKSAPWPPEVLSAMARTANRR